MILYYLLPDDTLIAYLCPLGKDHRVYSGPHGHWRCGSGPGWSCRSIKPARNLSIMRVCSEIYLDAVSLLYDRTFRAELSVDHFYFVNFNVLEVSLKGFPFADIKCTQVAITLSEAESEFQVLERRVKLFCEILAYAEELRRLEIQLLFHGCSSSLCTRVWQLLAPLAQLQKVNSASISLFQAYGDGDQHSCQLLAPPMALQSVLSPPHVDFNEFLRSRVNDAKTNPIS